ALRACVPSQPKLVCWLRTWLFDPRHLEQIRGLRTEEAFEADFLAGRRIDDGVALSEFEIGVRPGRRDRQAAVVNLNVDGHRFGGCLPQLAAALAFDFLLHRHAG